MLRPGVLSTDVRQGVTFHLRERGVDLVLLDIEGTTTPMAFVYDVLFPFARTRLEAYLRQHAQSSQLRDALAALRREWQEDDGRGEAPPAWDERVPLSAAAYLWWLMDRDRKSPTLKRLQGEIWETGFRSGALRGDLFPDVAAAFTRWHDSKVAIAVYSSGSTLAQRLIFGGSVAGDLTPFVTEFFDTAMGPKRSAESYRRIAAALRRSPSRMLFVSDVPEELDAAVAAGCHALLAVRPGNRAVEGLKGIEAITSFDEIVA